MADGIHVRGDLTVTLRDKRTGEVIFTDTVRNKIVNNGVAGLVALLAQNTGTTASNYQISRLEVGTGTTAAAAGNTELQMSRSTRKYVELDSTTRSVEPARLVITATIQDNDTSVNGVALSEAGLWMGPLASQIFFARQVHAPVTKLANQALEYRWVIQFTV